MTCLDKIILSLKQAEAELCNNDNPKLFPEPILTIKSASDSNQNKYFNNCMRFTIFIGQKVKWYLRVLDYDDQIRKHITGILLSDAFRRIQLDSTILAQNC